MLFMIDNYDSFTYNVVQYLGELGSQVLVNRNDEIEVDAIAELNPEFDPDARTAALAARLVHSLAL